MKMFMRTAVGLALGAVVAVCGVSSASAATWAQNHPRRVEVNHRLANQDHRINHDLRTGKIGFRQAAQLHREDRIARRDERFDASFHNGHLTRADQRSLNQDENGISRQIYRDAH